MLSFALSAMVEDFVLENASLVELVSEAGKFNVAAWKRQKPHVYKLQLIKFHEESNCLFTGVQRR